MLPMQQAVLNPKRTPCDRFMRPITFSLVIWQFVVKRGHHRLSVSLLSVLRAEAGSTSAGLPRVQAKERAHASPVAGEVLTSPVPGPLGVLGVSPAPPDRAPLPAPSHLKSSEGGHVDVFAEHWAP